MLPDVADCCKSRILKPFSLLGLARRCRVLRSQWCQSGVREDESVCTGSRGIALSEAGLSSMAILGSMTRFLDRQFKPLECASVFESCPRPPLATANSSAKRYLLLVCWGS